MSKSLLIALGLSVSLMQAPAFAQSQTGGAGGMEETYAQEDEGMDWGWLGLLGLAGLLGIRRREHHHHPTDRTTRP